MFWLSLLLAVTVTSFISGVFGMAGGMILMGVYGWTLPVTTAMVLHGVTQLSANGFRGLLLGRHIHWRTIAPYLAGAAGALALFGASGLVLPRWVLFLILGSLPFLSLLVTRVGAVDITRTRNALTCGLVATAMQLLAGVSGPLLDVFFLQTPLSPRGIVGTKALTQSLGHTVKLIYYGGLLSLGWPDIPLWVLPCIVAAALLGTALGRRILVRLDRSTFQSRSRHLLYVIGLVYLGRGLAELL